ncbi:putative tail fiber protein [Pseudomonas phage phiPMW]|uniref:Putative tail fiber protein n=1 Tax=Pseudomonas phage phiPMW TaxID=1815582 RepID=A0A1S5R1M4_9CAUD|nr:tail protein [Pseudomonas phage phiPMW]ANA49268.1 putative tail fiber protein [Pseudomonas phage phiPMW]
MIPHIHGMKGGSQKPHTPVETPNNLLSVAYAKILMAVAEGELAGNPTAQDIFLDGTPLANADGSFNFDGVKWEWRSGTQHQTYIQGMPEVATEYNIGTELTNVTSWTRTVTTPGLDAVRITMQFPALLKQETNGDTNGTSVEFAIDMSPIGQPLTEVARYTVTGKTNQAYEKTYRVDLPASTRGWTVRVRRVTPDSTSSMLQNKTVVKSYTEVKDLKQTYPHTALLYVEFDSRTFGGGNIPKISVRTKGRIVQVPSTYDPEARTYTGVWSGDFKWAWTNNPIWVYYDLVTQDRFALGHKITPDMVDKWALYELAQYCDVMVDDGTGFGGKVPRHTCNVYIQEQQDAYQVLRDIAGIFNGMTYWDGNKMVAVADKKEDLTNAPIFSRANVVNGRFDYPAADDKSIYTSALVSFDDPDNHYESTVAATWERSQMQRWGGDRQTNLSAIGCTSRSEAQRRGKYVLLTNMYNRMVKFRTGLQGLDQAVLPGSIIHVVDPLMGGRPFTGRVAAVVNQRQIYLDRDSGAKVGDTLYVTLRNGKTEGRQIMRIGGNSVTVSTAYTQDPPINSVWYLESSDLKSQLFRVTKVTNPDPAVFEIEGVEYNESKYDAIDNGARLESRPINQVPDRMQQAPASVNITSRTYVEQTMAVTTMTISWPQTPNAVSYEVQWRVGDGDWVNVGVTGANEIDIKGIYAGEYLARVRARNSIGIGSVWTTSTLTSLAGKAGKPPTIASLTTTPMFFGIRLDWTFPPGATDTLKTEIMYSQNANFTSAIKLGDFSYPLDYNEMHGLKAGQKFWFWTRLTDRTGNVGDWYPATNLPGIVGTAMINDDGQYNDYLAGMIGETMLDKALYERLELIDGPSPDSLKNQITSVANRVTINEDRITDAENSITEVTGDLNQYKTQTNNRLTAAEASITKVNGDLNTFKVETNAKITAANQKIDGINASLTTKINDTNTKVDNINTALGQRIDATNTALNAAVTDLQDQIDNISDALLYDPTKTYVKGDVVRMNNRLYQALGNVPLNSPPPNAALWQDIGSYGETINNLTIKVDKNTQDIGLIDGKLTSTVESLDLMRAAYRQDDGEGSLQDALRGWESEATIATEMLTRANEDEALAQRITTMSARVDESEAKINSMEQTIATNESAMAQRVYSLQAEVMDNRTEILSLNKVVAETNQVTAERLDSMSVAINETKGSISSLSEVVATSNNVLVQQVNTLSAELKNSNAIISDITTVIIDNNQALVERVNQIDTRVGTAETNITTLTQTVTTNNNATNLRIDNLTATVGQNTAKIGTLETTVANEKTATAQRFETMQTEVDGNKSAITSLTETVTTKDTATNQRIDSLTTKVNDNSAAITTLSETVTDLESATASQITQLTTRVGKAESDITTLAQTVTTKDTATNLRIDTLTSKVDGNTAKIGTLETTVATEKTATAQRFATMQTEVDGNKSAISTLTETVTTKDTATNQRIDTLTTTVNGNTSAITNLTKTVTDNNSATVSQINALTTRVGTTETNITTLTQTVNTKDAATNLRIDNLTATVNQNKADISTMQTTIVNNESATAQKFQTMQAEVNANKANISTLETTVATNNTAINTRVDNLTATVDGNTSKITTLTETVSTLESSVASIQTDISAIHTVGRDDDGEGDLNAALGDWGTQANIATEQKVRADANEAMASIITDLSAKFTTDIASMQATIHEESVARATADEALGQRIDTVQANFVTEQGRVNGLIQTEQTTRANADIALGQRIDTVQATAGNNSAAIQTLTSAQASTDGKVNASWQVKMELNAQGQYVAAGIGLGIENGPAGLQSQFLVRADRFAVVNGVNGTTSAPFVVQGGQVFIADAMINKATITNAIIGSTLSSQYSTTWGPALPTLVISFAQDGAIVMRNQVRPNTYATYTPDGVNIVVDGVTRVRMGTWQ